MQKALISHLQNSVTTRKKVFIWFGMCLTVSTVVVVTVNYFTSLLESDHIDTKIKYQTVLIRSFHTIKSANN